MKCHRYYEEAYLNQVDLINTSHPPGVHTGQISWPVLLRLRWTPPEWVTVVGFATSSGS